jgi:rare lipoprotein A
VGREHHGLKTASGEIYNENTMTAAHPFHPFGTRVLVTRLENGRSVAVRVNDRGPFVAGRIIDVSFMAAKKLGFVREGLAEVRIEVIPE